MRTPPAIALGLLLLAVPARALTSRVANTTLGLPQTGPAPESAAYQTTNAFPGLAFADPVAIATPPGETNRLFVVEQGGRIAVITNLAAPTIAVFMDITARVIFTGGNDERGLLGLAFHPGYASNRQFFVFYTANTGGLSNRVSRFTARADHPNAADTNSEVVLIGQHDQYINHNGGDLHFGPDGYLYVSLGDEGSSCDAGANSQTITNDFFAAILRMDVDKRPGSLPPNPHRSILAPTNYAIPPDNPFLGATQFNGLAINPASVRTEFWAVGLRNPFRIAFDEVTGELYAGDVGQGEREEINLVAPGGNYGWRWREGFIATPPGTCPSIGSPPAGFAHRNPILDYPHSDGYAVTGGRVYRGDRFPELVGRYIFCDYGSGNIWSLTNNGTNVTTKTHLATDTGIAGFGVDPRNGDLLLADRDQDQLKRLVRADATTNFPQTLSAAGVFANPGGLVPHAGIVPYELNVSFWSDNAAKRRWFSLPPTNLAIGFAAVDPWTFPTGMVWIKHFELELTSGVPDSARRLETRVLVKNASGNGGYGATYRWGHSTNEAYLVPDGGLDEAFVVTDGGTIRTQVWRYPSRAQCRACHDPDAGFALGFNTPQLNRDADYGGGDVTNQLARLAAVGYFSSNPPAAHRFRALAHPTNGTASLETRARSWLQANCAHCHFPDGGAPALFDARFQTPLSGAGLVNGALNNPQGDPANRAITPADVPHSMVHTRMALRGAGQMPPFGSSLVDTQGVALVAAWIGALAGYEDFAAWQLAHFGATNLPGTGPDEDFDGDGAINRQEYLAGTQPTNSASAWGAGAIAASPDGARVGFTRIANRLHSVQVATDLTAGAWADLDVPDNAPLAAASNAWIEVADPGATGGPSRFYRVELAEP